MSKKEEKVIRSAFDEVFQRMGIGRTWLAERLGCDPSWVSQMRSGGIKKVDSAMQIHIILRQEGFPVKLEELMWTPQQREQYTKEYQSEWKPAVRVH